MLHSRILDAAERWMGRMQGALSESRILQWCVSAYRRMSAETRFFATNVREKKRGNALLSGLVLGTLFALPFLSFLPHPSLWLCVLSSIAVGVCFFGGCLRPIDVLDASVLLFALSFLLGGVIGAGGTATLLSGVLCALLILFWFPVRVFLSNDVHRKYLRWALCLSGGILGGIGVLQYGLGYAELRWVDIDRFSDIGGRVVGSFSNPNIYAVYLLLVAPFLLYGILDPKIRKRAHMLCAFGFFAVLLALVFTWSRGAWLGFFGQTLLFFLCYSRRSAAGVTLLFLPAGLLFPLLPQNILNRFSSIGSLTDSSIRYRLYTWKGVLRMIAEHPFGIGVGSSAFSSVYPEYAVSGAEGAVHTHQIFLRVTSEQGLIGLLIFLTFLGLVLLGFASTFRRECVRRREACAPLSAIFGVLVMGFFDDVWYHGGMLLLFFAVAAMIAALAGFERGEEV